MAVDIEVWARELGIEDPDHLRLLLWVVWDEGYDAGMIDENTGWNAGWDRAVTPNPYQSRQPP